MTISFSFAKFFNHFHSVFGGNNFRKIFMRRSISWYKKNFIKAKLFNNCICEHCVPYMKRIKSSTKYCNFQFCLQNVIVGLDPTI